MADIALVERAGGDGVGIRPDVVGLVGVDRRFQVYAGKGYPEQTAWRKPSDVAAHDPRLPAVSDRYQGQGFVNSTADPFVGDDLGGKVGLLPGSLYLTAQVIIPRPIPSTFVEMEVEKVIRMWKVGPPAQQEQVGLAVVDFPKEYVRIRDNHSGADANSLQIGLDGVCRGFDLGEIETVHRTHPQRRSEPVGVARLGEQRARPVGIVGIVHQGVVTTPHRRR